MQFRRYVASVDQHDPQQVDRLGAALGTLIAEVATSKQEFLVNAAERDGFSFADGVFRPAETARRSFSISRLEDAATLDHRSRRLHLLASESPAAAVAGATELVESVCRTVLHLAGKPAPGKTTGLVELATSTLAALALVPAGGDGARKAATAVRTSLERLSAVVAGLGELRNGLSPRDARLAVGAAVTFACFVVETCAERGGEPTLRCDRSG